MVFLAPTPPGGRLPGAPISSIPPPAGGRAAASAGAGLGAGGPASTPVSSVPSARGAGAPEAGPCGPSAQPPPDVFSEVNLLLRASQLPPTARCLVTAKAFPPRALVRTRTAAARGRAEVTRWAAAPSGSLTGRPLAGSERHGLRRAGGRATGRGSGTAAGRAAAGRAEAAAAARRRAPAAGAPAPVPGGREGGQLLVPALGSQHHQMVRPGTPRL